MLITIDTASDRPVYEQIASCVRAEIAAGGVAPGGTLPPARSVATSLGVNVHTVLHAYQELRDEGLIELRRGKGAVVTGVADALGELVRDVHGLVARARTLGVAPETLASIMRDARV